MSWRTFFQGSLMALGVCASAQVMALSGLVLGSFSSQTMHARRAEVEFVMREPVRVVAAVTQLYRVVVAADGLSLNNCGRERSPQGWDALAYRITYSHR